jgi:hypothetical protein
MTRRRSRRTIQPSNLFLLALAAGCLTDSVEYTPQRDIQAFDEIERAWSTSGGLQLSLCEDRSAPGPDVANTCQIEHVVRGDGSAPAHSEPRGGGCGGCPFENVAYVRGTVSGGGLAQPLVITGTIYLGGAGSDPYDYPYNIGLSCAAPASCELYGQLEADGTLAIDSVTGLDITHASLAFAPTGRAACGTTAALSSPR